MILALDVSATGVVAPASGAEGWRGGRLISSRLLSVGAAASAAAGMIHMAALAAHSEHRQAVWAFLGVAVVQLVWGTLAWARPGWQGAVVGLGIALLGLGGWVMAKTGGLAFIDGLDDKEPVHFADGLAAGLALTTFLASGAALLAGRRLFSRTVTAVAIAGIGILAVPGVVAGVNHPHDGGHLSSDWSRVVAASVPPRPFDPELPIDLGGVDGVTPQQQARAENLLASTVLRLPQWSDPKYAESKGYRSIGDGGLGEEHYVNQTFITNDTILDPDEPESLVYDTTVKPKKLVAAMYMLTPGSGLANAPDIGGALTQWHIHNNLCFNTAGRIAGLTGGDGGCVAPLVKGPETPMIHVWIEPHPCGPFSALEGIAGGQVAEGETVACDELHGL